jgi:hypothetical protein
MSPRMAAEARSRSGSPAAGGSTPDFRLLLWLLIGVGVVARVLLAFTTPGQRYDLQSYAIVNSALHAHVFGIYHQVDDYSVPPYGRWPYPPGFFAAIVPLASFAHATGLSFTSLIRLPAVVSDAGIAWLAQDFLRRRGRGETTRLLAVALIALGPSFAAISGYHGQIDSVAILPAVAAVWLWERTDADWRPYAAGALIGLGAAIKTVPVLTLIALVPAARSPREAAKLVIVAVGLPALAFAPWLILDGPGKGLPLRYRGGPGLGGLSLLSAPDLPKAAFGVAHETVGGLTKALYDNARFVTGAALAAVAAIALRYRPRPVHAAVLVWLAVWAFGVTFFPQYLVWGLPFLIMAGYLREALALQALVLPATVVTYATGLHGWQVWLFYTFPMIVLWAASVVGLVLLVRKEAISSSAAWLPRRTA